MTRRGFQAGRGVVEVVRIGVVTYGVTPTTITSYGILYGSTEARAEVQVDVVWILYHQVMTCLEYRSLNSRSQKFYDFSATAEEITIKIDGHEGV